jgi:hypothetical protein
VELLTPLSDADLEGPIWKDYCAKNKAPRNWGLSAK